MEGKEIEPRKTGPEETEETRMLEHGLYVIAFLAQLFFLILPIPFIWMMLFK